MTLTRHQYGVMVSSMELTRWSVIWLNPKGKWVEKKPGPEFPGLNFVDALELYERVRVAGRKGVTLRCTNVGFPPPARFMPRVVRVKVLNSKGKPTKRNGEYVYKEVLRVPLKKLNKRGIWWCPHCMKFRRFKIIKNKHTRTYVHRCPVCNIDHRNHHVRAHNPVARTLPI